MVACVTMLLLLIKFKCSFRGVKQLAVPDPILCDPNMSHNFFGRKDFSVLLLKCYACQMGGFWNRKRHWLARLLFGKGTSVHLPRK